MKGLINKIFASRYWWLLLLVAVFAVNYIASFIQVRADLTKEKRYTLSKATKRLVKKLDDVVQRQSLAAAEQQISGIQAQLEQANSIYERQQNLWKQNIGTEVQVLNAKTNSETLKSHLASAQASIRL